MAIAILEVSLLSEIQAIRKRGLKQSYKDFNLRSHLLILPTLKVEIILVVLSHNLANLLTPVKLSINSDSFGFQRNPHFENAVMNKRLESKPQSSERQQVASLLSRLGWAGFWIQLVLTVVAGMILTFAILDPNLNLRLKSGIGLVSAIGGIAALGFSIYWCFRYVRLGRQLKTPELTVHPSRKETIHVLQIGGFINLVAMLLTLVGIQTIIGTLLIKTLSVPQGAAVYQVGQLIEPIDIFVVQANVSMIAAQFVGIGIPFWLASRVEHH